MLLDQDASLLGHPDRRFPPLLDPTATPSVRPMVSDEAQHESRKPRGRWLTACTPRGPITTRLFVQTKTLLSHSIAPSDHSESSEPAPPAPEDPGGNVPNTPPTFSARRSRGAEGPLASIPSPLPRAAPGCGAVRAHRSLHGMLSCVSRLRGAQGAELELLGKVGRAKGGPTVGAQVAPPHGKASSCLAVGRPYRRRSCRQQVSTGHGGLHQVPGRVPRE